MTEGAQQSANGKYEAGDIVDVKGHGRATVLELGEPSGPHAGRVLVRYHEDDTTYWCNPKKLRKLHLASRRILVARFTHAYRDAVVHNVDRPDVCLEIGCHEGMTTNIISNRATFVCGIDTAHEVVAIAAQRHPHLPFHVLDGLDTCATRRLSPAGTFNRIMIDISGKSPLDLICQMVAAQRQAFPDAWLIVKNEQLYDALVRHEQQQQQQGRSAAADEQQAAGERQQGGEEGEQGSLSSVRLRELLGQHLDECEVFRHEFRPPRTRPTKPRAAKGQHQQERGLGQSQPDSDSAGSPQAPR